MSVSGRIVERYLRSGPCRLAGPSRVPVVAGFELDIKADVCVVRSVLVDRPTIEIEGCRSAHARLAVALGELTDSVARRPSLLPDWTVGHVLSHLARNAEAMVRRVEAAARGELVDQYDGGVLGRAAEIEAGAHRAADELVADVCSWSQLLDECFASLDDECWERPVRSVQGSLHPVARLPFRRWREVEVHLVDLRVGFGPDEWPEQFVERALPNLLAGLAQRADHRSLTVWLLGRGSPPTLQTWG